MAVIKACTKCKKRKSPSEFWKNKTGRDGLFTQCKSCMSVVNIKATKIYRNKNPWRARLVLYNKRHKSELKEKDIIGLFDKQNKSCALCGLGLDSSWGTGNIHLDHIVPRCVGGNTDIKNIQILCPMCNIGKHKWTSLEYIAHCQRVSLFDKKEV